MGDPDNPATWKLPIETYMLTAQQERTIEGIRDELIDACMARNGFASWKPPPSLPALSGKSLVDRRYGIHDAALAARRGYRPDVGEQKAYDEAMLEGAVDRTGADPQTEESCTLGAGSSAPMDAPSPLVEKISRESFQAAAADPRVKAVLAEWSACMKGKGHTYAKPKDAQDDLRFNNRDTVTALEIATATADVACRNEHQVTRTWFDVEARLQQKAIRAHQADLEQVKASNQAAVAQAQTMSK
ncbi:hypothetical protein ABT160_33500 [Streptomyces sp. NPDC001941]|uniref:hypothetical protein n=1 Tax=Streptomyces sp. NPDC001941 TaxID=3154659 RepID=UPI00331921F5